MLPQSVAGLIAPAVEDMWPGIITGKTQRPNGHGTEGWAVRGMRCYPEFITIRFFGQSLLVGHSVPAAASGMITLGWVEIQPVATTPPCLITGNMVPLAMT